MEIAKRLEGITEYYFSQKLREIDALNKAGKQVINLGIGSPDLPPHPDVIKVLNEESIKPNVHAYQGYKGSPVLRNAFAEWYQKWYEVTLDPDTEILPLMGSKEGILHICMTYINAGDEVLIPNPGYPTYKTAAMLAGANCLFYNLDPENSWFPDLKALAKLDLSKVKLMFVNYTHMPTGQLPTLKMFEELVAFAKEHDLLLVHDNPYSFLLPSWDEGQRPLSLLSVRGAKEVSLELNSLSKSHQMAGWRIGVLVGEKERINEVMRFKTNMDSGMFLPLQLAAAKALCLGESWFCEINALYALRRKKLYDMLTMLGCSFDPKQAGMFAWAAIPQDFKDGFAFSDEILNTASVFITPGGIFGTAGEGYCRVSLCATPETIMEASDRIKHSTILSGTIKTMS